MTKSVFLFSFYIFSRRSIGCQELTSFTSLSSFSQLIYFKILNLNWFLFSENWDGEDIDQSTPYWSKNNVCINTMISFSLNIPIPTTVYGNLAILLTKSYPASSGSSVRTSRRVETLWVRLRGCLSDETVRSVFRKGRYDLVLVQFFFKISSSPFFMATARFCRILLNDGNCSWVSQEK